MTASSRRPVPPPGRRRCRKANIRANKPVPECRTQSHAVAATILWTAVSTSQNTTSGTIRHELRWYRATYGSEGWGFEFLRARWVSPPQRANIGLDAHSFGSQVGSPADRHGSTRSTQNDRTDRQTATPTSRNAVSRRSGRRRQARRTPPVPPVIMSWLTHDGPSKQRVVTDDPAASWAGGNPDWRIHGRARCTSSRAREPPRRRNRVRQPVSCQVSAVGSDRRTGRCCP